jgi:DNA-binding SARP family transcriptional activator
VSGRTRGRRGAGTVLRGALALATLAALVAGLPVVLYKLGGDPLPRHIPAWQHVTSLLLHRDNGSVFFGAVRDVSWIAWAAFTVAVATEAQAALRGRSAPRLRLAGVQNAASWLVALAALAFSSQPAAALASTPVPVTVAAAVRPATPAARPADQSADTQGMSMGFYQMVTVRSGDCLWTIAQHYLGNGDLYPEIVKLNLGHDMGDGQRFTDPSVVWPGWVLQVPASPDRAPSSAGPATPAGHAASQHSGHSSSDPRFSHAHRAAAAARPAADTAGVPAATSMAGAEPTAPAPAHRAEPAHPAASAASAAPGASAASGVSAASQAHAGELRQIPPLAVFASGVLVGGMSVALARMRRRQRQARRFGRRIPLPVSAPVVAAEQRLRAAAGQCSTADQAPLYPGVPEPESLYPGVPGAYAEGVLEEPEPYPGVLEEPESLYPGAPGAYAEDVMPESDGATLRSWPPLQPETALRAALSQLGAALAAAGQPIPDITGLRVHQSSLELLLDSPASEPPPVPFAVPGGRQGKAWQLELPRHAPSPPFLPAETGDLLPGLLTAGLADDGGYVLIDLEYLRVTTVDGPADLADLVLASAAAELTTSQLAGWYDLILVGFPELEAVDGRATNCASLAEALDLLAAKAVALQRRLGDLGDADRADVRRRRLADPGDEDWALTLLVSRISPTAGQMAMLLDLASDPGGIAALVVGGTDAPEGHPVPASFRLDTDLEGIAGHVSPLHLDVWPQPLTKDDYEALASLFQVAAERGDVAADEPPYDGSSWPPARGLVGLREPPEPGPAGGDGERAPSSGAAPFLAPDQEPREHPSGRPGQHGRDGDENERGLRIGVLGTFTVNGAPAALQPAQSQLILALALNGRDGLSNAQLCYLLGPDPDHPKPSDSLRQLIVRTRRQLGRAADGREWIEHLGAGQYALHPDALFDWAAFEELSERGIAHRDLGCLRDALALIRGKPFTGCYHWWLDVAFTETVRAQIVDTAELLAELELAAGDPSASARAARTGLAADVAAEQLWRAVMRAEHAAGNLAGVREAWSKCLDTMTDIAADGEPHPDTAALYQRLTGADRPQPAWARSYR